MKKLLLILLAVTVVFGFSACNDSSGTALVSGDYNVADEDALVTAIETAESGDVIALTDDITMEATALTISKSLTIEGNGFTLTIPGDAKDYSSSGIYISGMESGDVAIKNLTVKATGTYGSQTALIYLHYCGATNVTLSDVTLDCAGTGALGISSTYSLTGTLTVDNCKINDSKYGIYLNSAGNAGNDRWKKISVPADATDILTVGAVDSLRRNTLFSSLGNTADGRIKPDVMALGEGAAAFEVDGSITRVNGTSFSTPILCGMVACLWQAFPDRRPEEVIDAVRRSADNANHPDNVYGYGIPDMWKAYQILKED